MAQIKTYTVKSAHDGLALSVSELLPEGRPRALVQLAHGMAEHKERYFPLMRFLADNGFACIVNDHRGHGASVRSADDLGYFYANGDDGLLKDMKQLSDAFCAAHPGLPLFLLGHSMGSLAARAYAARYGRCLRGLVLSGSPGENGAAGMGLLLTHISALLHGGEHGKSAFLAGLVGGSFAKRFPGGSPFAWLSANEANVKAYEADPLCGFPFTINGYRALLRLMQAAYDKKAPMPPELPVHFMSGEDDPCAPDRAGFESAMQNLRARGSKTVTGKMYPHLRHEIFNENEPVVLEDLLKQLEAWLAEPTL